jgi:hypothetical protein
MEKKERLAKKQSDLPLSVWQFNIGSKVQPLEPQQATSKLVLVIAVPVVDSAVAVPCIAVSALKHPCFAVQNIASHQGCMCL